MKLFVGFAFVATMLFAVPCLAESVAYVDSTKLAASPDTSESSSAAPDRSVNIRGYVQVRYHGLLQSNPELECQQCDRAWGGKGGFSLRRVRLVFSGNASDRLAYYVQADFASTVGGAMNVGQLRDAYMDVGLTEGNTWRLRIGQSKIPFGFENLQSSQNRIPLDRNDGLNSGLANERDLGAFLYWASSEKRALFRELVRSGLKGSGDYGVAAVGIFNGQTVNHADLNRQPHVVARFSYPFKYGGQIFEPGLQAYAGNYVMDLDDLSGSADVRETRSFLDARMAASFVWYPQPIGIQAEYNLGRGPEYVPGANEIQERPLEGGYIMLNAKWDVSRQTFIPFVRANRYDGGKKHETDARSYRVRELETGVEWRLDRHFEIVAMYTFSSRRFEDALNPNNLQKGRLLRLQAQLSF